MAVTTINLSDPVSTLVTKTNTISTNLGDAAALETTATNVVAAINEVRDQIVDIDDSAEIVTISRGGLSVNNDAALGLSLSYNSSTGVISLSGAADEATVKGYFASDSAGGILFDSAAGQFSIAPNTVTNSMILASTIRSNRFYNAVSLVIYDQGGSPVKTLYSPGA